jgi:flagellar motor protein MotB
MTLRHGCLFGLLALGFAFSGAGCSHADKERDALRTQNQEYANQLAANKAKIDELQKRLDDANMSKIPSTPTAAAEAPATTEPAPEATADAMPDMGPVDAGEGITMRKTARGETELEIVGDVLFAPGKATIKPAAMRSLNKAVSILKTKYAGKHLRIEGHTDPPPVRGSGWDDNYDLGAARARAVLLYLKAHGIHEKNMYIASFGANQLRSTKNYALDRRVDIVVEK